jgi:hypothetical protein
MCAPCMCVSPPSECYHNATIHTMKGDDAKSSCVEVTPNCFCMVLVQICDTRRSSKSRI